MTKEYEAYLAYRKVRQPVKKENDPVYADFLIHYGVKGQKWGTRQWQNADGTYTEAGKHHYGWGYGRQTSQNGAIAPVARRPRTGSRVDGYQRSRQRIGTRTATSDPGTAKRQLTPAEIEARKARTRKILGIAAGVAVTAAVSYAAYKGSTKLRDNMRSDVYKNFNTDSRNLNTLTSKYWNSSDRRKYSELATKRANDVANSIGRKEAIAAKFAEKTGLQISVPQNRKKELAMRRSENEFSNFIRDAEKRGSLNKSIHDVRQELREQQKRLEVYRNTQHIGTSKQYEELWTRKRQENIELARERLNNLLLQRRAG